MGRRLKISIEKLLEDSHTYLEVYIFIGNR